MPDSLEIHQKLAKALHDPQRYPHPVAKVEEIQTHISTVLLTGDYAYKIKKPLDFGFLNFTSLADRKHFCEEEIRLNRRLAPQLYLDVVAVTGSPEAPELNGAGEPFEYMVRMRQFDQEGLLNNVLARGELSADMIDEIARRMAAFHTEAAVSGPDAPFGTADMVVAPMRQNFEQLRPLLQDADRLAQLERIEAWTESEFDRLKPLLDARKLGGFIRECHGDMHLGNMALVNGEIDIFDGIEFNDSFRWIDVMSELAFLVMDLDDRGQHGFASRVRNLYLQASGDYAGLPLLRFYQVYRAMVRAKVSSLRLAQPDLSDQERASTLRAYQSYADLAERYTSESADGLIITHGFSGSGKSTYSQQLVDELGAIRLRSDVERKRLHDLDEQARTKSGIAQGLYAPEATARVYEHLSELARAIIDAGYVCVVDATFLKQAQRAPFRDLAREIGTGFTILDLQADEARLSANIRAREREGGDASEADLEVLRHQLANHDPLAADEPSIQVQVGDPLPLDSIRQVLGLPSGADQQTALA
ncbi:MAG: AAA family ATPase [Gammaproteobacteria bacterium]|jgi:aminoglycoside phosphotransferase family enzyme/predicted kinase